jgi:hypothetical protein
LQPTIELLVLGLQLCTLLAELSLDLLMLGLQLLQHLHAALDRGWQGLNELLRGRLQAQLLQLLLRVRQAGVGKVSGLACSSWQAPFQLIACIVLSKRDSLQELGQPERWLVTAVKLFWSVTGSPQAPRFKASSYRQMPDAALLTAPQSEKPLPPFLLICDLKEEQRLRTAKCCWFSHRWL